MDYLHTLVSEASDASSRHVFCFNRCLYLTPISARRVWPLCTRLGEAHILRAELRAVRACARPLTTFSTVSLCWDQHERRFAQKILRISQTS